MKIFINEIAQDASQIRTDIGILKKKNVGLWLFVKNILQVSGTA